MIVSPQPPKETPPHTPRGLNLAENSALPATLQPAAAACPVKPALGATIAALTDVQQALSAMKIEGVNKEWRPSSEQELLSELQAIHTLSQATNLSDSEKESLRDKFDIISTAAAKTAIVTGAQRGYWEVEIPNLSFLQERNVAVVAGSLLEKICETAQMCRKLLGNHSGRSFSEESAIRATRKASPKAKARVAFADTQAIDSHRIYLQQENRTLDQLKLVYAKLNEQSREAKKSPSLDMAYKALLDQLYRLSTLPNNEEVKAFINEMEFSDLLQQSILHKDVKILTLAGFAQDEEKASLINHLIRNNRPEELAAILTAGFKSQVNKLDQEKSLPLATAIQEAKLEHAAILVQHGATLKALQGEEKHALLAKAGELLANQPPNSPHIPLLTWLQKQ